MSAAERSDTHLPACTGQPRFGARMTCRMLQAYLTGLLGLLGLLWTTGDRWWPATVLLFGPRWTMLVPLLLLVPLALVQRRRENLWWLAALAVVGGCFLGVTIPWQRLGGLFAAPPDLSVRVVTYNCGHTDDEPVVGLIHRLQPDIITLNEWHPSRPLPAALTEGRHVARAGGNVVLSRFSIEAIESLQSDQLKRWEHRALGCLLQTAAGPIRVVCVHLETPRHGLSEFRHSLWRGADEMRRNTEKRRLEAELASEFVGKSSAPLIVAGDFNTPVESRIYQRYWSGWQNVFSQAGLGLGYTKYTRFFGVRIDHILVSSHWRSRSAWIGPDLGGDHRPVVAELALRP